MFIGDWAAGQTALRAKNCVSETLAIMALVMSCAGSASTPEASSEAGAAAEAGHFMGAKNFFFVKYTFNLTLSWLKGFRTCYESCRKGKAPKVARKLKQKTQQTNLNS